MKITSFLLISLLVTGSTVAAADAELKATDSGRAELSGKVHQFKAPCEGSAVLYLKVQTNP